MILVDCETYSVTPIKNGHFRYAEDAELLMIAWAVDDGPVQVWDCTSETRPHDLTKALFSEDILIAHNASFEQAIFEKQNIIINSNRWHCTMAQAYAHGLPGSLENLGAVLGLPIDRQKAKAGYDLIRLFCIPPAKNVKRERATKLTHPKQWEEFKNYCKQDIIATREIYKKLPKWNYQGFELGLWHLDQKINTNGVYIDLELANAAIRAVDLEQASLRKRTEDLTLGDVSSATKRDAMLKHILAAYGVELPDMQASTLERRIEDPDLPEGLKELLAIRLQATTSSTAKYKRLVGATCSDSRLRGALQWCGAARTGRDSGRLFQPQNLMRPTLKNKEINFGIEALKADCANLVYDNVMELISNATRGVIAAPPGKKLLVADLANIEGRYAAWLAGEEWKLQAFRDYDLGIGHDTYALSYAKPFNVTPESVMEDKKAGGNQRQIGKTMELALQFAGGIGAFITFATSFGIDLHDLVRDAWDTIPGWAMAEAIRFWEWSLPHPAYIDDILITTPDQTMGLDKDVFITCDSLKRLWRKAHPEISSMWGELDVAVRNAINIPKETFNCRRLKVRRDGNWLRILMPSGRCLCYPHPEIDKKNNITFMGTDQYTRQWGRIKTFGGKLFANTVQGGARDVFMHGVVNASKAGYDCVMRIHDEQICEVPDTDAYTVDKLCELMTTNIPWCEDLPLAASGFETYRYRKGD